MRLNLLLRWRSADGNDYLCGYCKAQNQVPGKSGIPGMVGPRGFGKVAAAESMWWSGLKTSKGKDTLPHVCLCCKMVSEKS